MSMANLLWFGSDGCSLQRKRYDKFAPITDGMKNAAFGASAQFIF
jgi:hypothetical protein